MKMNEPDPYLSIQMNPINIIPSGEKKLTAEYISFI